MIHQPITADQMRSDFLFSLYQQGKVTVLDNPNLTGREIAVAFALDHGIPLDKFFGRTRVREIAHPRQDCMRLIRDRTGLSLPQVGRIFKRDHTTVLHAIRASERRAAQ